MHEINLERELKKRRNKLINSHQSIKKCLARNFSKKFREIFCVCVCSARLNLNSKLIDRER